VVGEGVADAGVVGICWATDGTADTASNIAAS